MSSEQIQFSGIVCPPAPKAAGNLKANVEVPALALRSIQKVSNGDGYSTRSTSRLPRGISLPKLNLVQNVKETMTSFLSSRTPRVQGRMASALRLQITESRAKGFGGDGTSASRPFSARPMIHELSRSQSLPQLDRAQEDSKSRPSRDLFTRRESGHKERSCSRIAQEVPCEDITIHEGWLCAPGQTFVLQQLLMRLYHCKLSDADASAVMSCCPEVDWLAECASACPLPVGWSHCQVNEKQLAFVNERTREICDEPPNLDVFVRLAWCTIQARMRPSNVSKLASYIHKVARNNAQQAQCLEGCWTGPHYDSASGLPYYHCPSADISSWQSPVHELQYVSRVAYSLLESSVFDTNGSFGSNAKMATNQHFDNLIQEGELEAKRWSASSVHSRRTRTHSTCRRPQQCRPRPPALSDDLNSSKTDQCRISATSRSTSASTGQSRSHSQEVSHVSGTVTPDSQTPETQDLRHSNSSLVCSSRGRYENKSSTSCLAEGWTLVDDEKGALGTSDPDHVDEVSGSTMDTHELSKGGAVASTSLESDQKEFSSLKASLVFAPRARSWTRTAAAADDRKDFLETFQVASAKRRGLQRNLSGVLLPPLAK